jgi:hypothetical protein
VNWTDLASTNTSLFPQVGTSVEIAGSGGGSGAIVYAITVSGAIVGFNIISGGTGYSGTITVTLFGAGTGASATATQSGGVINAVTLVSGGTGYKGTAPAWDLTFANNWVNVLVSYLSAWPSTVNGNQQNLSNLLTLGINAAADTDSLMLYSPALSSAGMQDGPLFWMRACSYDTANHNRDFGLQVETTSDGGNGVLQFLSRLDGGSSSTILEVDQSGNLTVVGKLVSYDGTSLAGLGQPIIVYSAVLGTTFTADQSGTAYVVPTTGWYKVSMNCALRVPATSSSTIPTTSIAYNNGYNNVSPGSLAYTTYNPSSNGGNAQSFGSFMIYAYAGSSITYTQSGYASSGAAAMEFALGFLIQYYGQ